MKTSLLLFLLLLVVGCDSVPKDSNFIPQYDSLTRAEDRIKEANKAAVVIQKQGAKPQSVESTIIIKNHAEALKELTYSKAENLKLADINVLNKSIALKALNNERQMSIKHAQSQGSIWKRNFIIIGLVLLIGGFVALFIFKQALRNNPWTGWLVRILLG